MHYAVIAAKMKAMKPELKGRMIEKAIEEVVKKYKARGKHIRLLDPPGSIVKHSNGNSYMVTKDGRLERI